MKRFDKIAIVGVGLIGGSIGLAVKKRGVAGEVVGVFRRASTMKRAMKRRAIDRGTLSIKDGVRDADLVILAAPVYTIVETAKEVFKYAKPQAIVTDVGSTKSWIVNKVESLKSYSGKSIFFVGSHPMAGSERAGVEAARSDLLEGAPCIVTKTPRTNSSAVSKIISFWKSLGADVKILTPKQHDESVSLASHLPHIVAFALAGAVPLKDFKYAAEGFKDTTRVASSDPQLWADIFLTNRKEIAAACRVFEKYYASVVRAITRGNYKGTVKLLKAAKSKRDKFSYGKR